MIRLLIFHYLYVQSTFGSFGVFLRSFVLSFVLLLRSPAGLVGLEGGKRSQVDLLLRLGPHHEGGRVDQVLAHADMSLLDDDPSLVDGLGVEGILGDSSLESALEQLVGCEAEHVIELEFLGGEEAVAVHSSEEGGAFEESPGVLLFEGEELTGGLPELGEGEVDSPDFSLILEPVLADELKFVIDSLLLVGSPGSLVGGGVCIKECVQLR